LASRAAALAYKLTDAAGFDRTQFDRIMTQRERQSDILRGMKNEVDRVRRREFIKVVGWSAASLPFAARAQQPTLPVIGYLDLQTPDATAPFLAGFRQGLAETGFVEGRDAAIEYRWAENHYERLPALAADLVQRKVDVIAAINLPSALAAKEATKSIPVVFGIGGDPIALGLVASLNRPGGNITGITQLSIEGFAKRLEMMHEIVPSVTSIAFLTNPTNRRNAEAEEKEAQAAGRVLGLQVIGLSASSPTQVDAAFASIVEQRLGALLVSPDPFFIAQRDQLIALALRHAIPSGYHRREFPVSGGLISYGPSYTDGYRQVAVYVGKILKGAKPADLPVEQSAKFELVINLRTAKGLGMTIPPALLARADEVIE
jgi:putative ABC transport system substrate-binding protein